MTKKPGREIEAALKENIALEAPRNRRRQRILVARFVVHPNQIMSGRSSCWTTRHELSIPGVGIDAEEARAGDRKAARQDRKLTVENSFFRAKVRVFGLDPGMSTPDRSDARPRLPGSLDPPAVRVVVARMLGGLPPQRPANDDSVLDAAERRAVHLPGTTLARCPCAHYYKCKSNSRLAWCDRRRRPGQLSTQNDVHGLIHAGNRTWTLAYRRWLTTIRFDHAAQADRPAGLHPCRAASRGAGRAADSPNRRTGAKLVAGTSGTGVPRDARRRIHRRPPRWRLRALRQSSPTDGLYGVAIVPRYGSVSAIELHLISGRSTALPTWPTGTAGNRPGVPHGEAYRGRRRPRTPAQWRRCVGRPVSAARG